MRNASPGPGFRLSIPSDEVVFDEFLTRSGTFKDGDLLVNKYGIRIVSQNEQDESVPIKPSDDQLNLADIDMIKVIGKCSGGIVQLVQHKFTGQFFALKAIQMKIGEEKRKQIGRELKINLFSQCPFVVLCYQCFYDNGVISIVMEYMDGGSLADFLKKVKLIPLPYLAAICKQVVKGLIYLHHVMHIMHRDLKPSNILINHWGEVKITDFGVSVILSSTFCQRDTFTGTLAYMSPERIDGSHHYDIRSDIWSLGLVLLECATGKYPYPSYDENSGLDGIYELLEVVVNQPAPIASPDKFSVEFCSFISACVQKDPKDRWSAADLLNHPFLSKYDDLNVDLAAYFINSGSTLATF